MGKFWLIVIMLLIFLIGGGAGYLMTTDIPAPTEHTEKVLPDDMFPK
ncbi:hypothetical protein [Emcibacter sp.]